MLFQGVRSSRTMLTLFFIVFITVSLVSPEADAWCVYNKLSGGSGPVLAHNNRWHAKIDVGQQVCCNYSDNRCNPGTDPNKRMQFTVSGDCHWAPIGGGTCGWYHQCTIKAGGYINVFDNGLQCFDQ